MVSFNKFFKSVFLAVTYASATSASPFPGSAKHATHRVREVGRGLQVETFHPPSSFETFGTGIDHPLSKRDNPDLEESTIAFVESKLGVAKDAISFKSGFAGETAKHAFVKQSHDGIPFANAVANVAFNNDNKVVSFGSSFVKPKKIASSTPSVSLTDAIAKAEELIDGQHNDHPPTLEFLALQDGSVALTHVIQIQNDETGAWVEAFIDAHTGELHSVTDFVAKASYRVLPIQKEILTQGFETLTDPQDLTASPQGWHSDGTTSTTTTAGNNAIAFKGSQTSVTGQSSATDNFIFTQSATTAPTTQANLDAARTNAFYIVNSVHDIAYKYGFTESSFNFQNNNFGKGGSGNDRVTVSVQDSAGTNNADFATPADGQSGRMRYSRIVVFLWTQTSPQRDGALENDIIVHENTHGITNRMTGGGTGRCLQTTEAGGMGEGWSDAMAEWTEHTSAAFPDYVMGQYVINSPAGIRTHPYSTSATVNPLRYSTIATLNEVHDIGEVWANILHNVHAALVGVHGFSTTARTDPTGTAGNVVFLHLFIDALALQPCNPTLPTARDAWIQADVNRFGGANSCTLWRAFASRGLGVGAANHRDSTTVPAGC
ncbi:hypothetical protein BDN71DRAFT_1484991 [Pleurotus eryngii]|uniref:Extracellular metalloproteinase n=1 Tax=Pleurotus eryngii TaxID=5323 RepID=A0A9P5ZIJ5_PLEER|nr:hypothetical protein BDN71DRAFT_1484991 [Pleurotus eryngii]